MKKAIIAVISLFIMVLTLTSCTMDVSINYYEDLQPNETVTSTRMTNGVSTCSHDIFVITCTNMKDSMNYASTKVRVDVVANLDNTSSTIYTLVKSLETKSNLISSPTLLIDYDSDVLMANTLSRMSNSFSFYVSLNLESSTSLISSYQYSLVMVFCNDTYIIKLY